MEAGDDGRGDVDSDPARSGGGLSAGIGYSIPDDVAGALDDAKYADDDLGFLSYYDDGIVTLRMHHVADINWVRKSPIQYVLDGVRRNYSQDFMVKSLNILQMLLKNPQTLVRIVADKDCICRIPECNIYGCGEVFAPHDKDLMGKYGIEEGKVYTVGEMMSLVHIGKEYYMTTTIVLGYDEQGKPDPKRTTVASPPDHWDTE